MPFSPSKVETVATCALRWSLEAAGGTAPDAAHQNLGTLVHSIAESAPSGSLADLRAELDRRWPELALPEGWPSRQLRRRADRMVEKLAAYLAEAGEPVLVEPSFDVTVGRARLRGTIDRVEDAGEGKVRVVDLKTGRLMKNPDMIPQFKTGSGIIGQPTTFRGPDGRQYVAILSGVGGWVGSIVTNNPDPRDPSAQKGFANMTGELKKITQPGGMLYVFALPRP